MYPTRKILGIGAALLLGSNAFGVVVTFNDTLLANGAFTWSSGGVNLTLSGGVIGSYSVGSYVGAWIGLNVASTGVYTLSLSQAVTSFEFEFDALSDIGQPPAETISLIGTNPSGATLSYTNQFGTSFDGSIITSTENDGQGIIKLTSVTPFTSVTFTHTQHPSQNGFLIERVTIDTGSGGTGTGGVPDSGTTAALLGLSLFGLIAVRRKLA